MLFGINVHCLNKCIVLVDVILIESCIYIHSNVVFIATLLFLLLRLFTGHSESGENSFICIYLY